MSNYLWEAQGVRGNWPFAISENFSNLNDRFPVNVAETTFSPDLDVQFGSTVAPNAQHIVPRHNRNQLFAAVEPARAAAADGGVDGRTRLCGHEEV